MSEIKPGVINVWTDGSCQPNPGPGGWGYVIKYYDGSATMDNGHKRDTTNNRMELTAILHALQALEPEDEVIIHTDSQLVIGWLVKGWKRRQPEIQDLCARIHALSSQHAMDVTYEWVRGHNGDKYNEMADKMAKAARQFAAERS